VAKESVILDKRIVSSDKLGNEMAWFLHQYADKTTAWKPQVTYSTGRIDNPVWMPLPGSQRTFLECPIFETLFEGPRGGGLTGHILRSRVSILTNQVPCIK
jgi:hypothetical protein